MARKLNDEELRFINKLRKAIGEKPLKKGTHIVYVGSLRCLNNK